MRLRSILFRFAYGWKLGAFTKLILDPSNITRILRPLCLHLDGRQNLPAITASATKVSTPLSPAKYSNCAKTRVGLPQCEEKLLRLRGHVDQR